MREVFKASFDQIEIIGGSTTLMHGIRKSRKNESDFRKLGFAVGIYNPQHNIKLLAHIFEKDIMVGSREISINNRFKDVFTFYTLDMMIATMDLVPKKFDAMLMHSQNKGSYYTMDDKCIAQWIEQVVKKVALKEIPPRSSAGKLHNATTLEQRYAWSVLRRSSEIIEPKTVTLLAGDIWNVCHRQYTHNINKEMSKLLKYKSIRTFI